MNCSDKLASMRFGSDVNAPLVTFAIFAFNQEKYIREAVLGAFSQTYSPIEIIISDDYSSDATFDLIKDLVANYSGPHDVKINRSPINLGTAAHVSSVFALSSGRIFVVAAGDDISDQNRVAKIVSAWTEHGRGPALIHSAMTQFEEKFDKDSERLCTKDNPNDLIISVSQFVENWKMPAYAPTCAYSREIFECFPRLTGGSLIEDLPLMLRSLAVAKLIYISEPLVLARKLDESSGQGFSILQPDRWNRFVHSRITALYDVMRDSKFMNESVDYKTLSALRAKVRRKLTSHARLFVDPRPKHSLISRSRIMFRIVFGEAISGGFNERLKFAVIFSFPEIYMRYKRKRAEKRANT